MASAQPSAIVGLAVGTIFFVQLSCYIEEWIFKALPGFKFHWFVAVMHHRTRTQCLCHRVSE